MKRFMKTLFGAAAALALAGPALALESGDTVRIIVPYSPGGGYDTQARLIAPYVEAELRERGVDGVSVIVENIRGSGGAVGTAAVYEADPDGTTLLLMDPESSIYHELLSDAPFEVDKFSYIAQQSSDKLVFAIRKDLGIESFEEAVARSKETPILMGASGGTGYGLVFPVVIRKMLADAGTMIEFDYVPMSGTSEVVASMRRGEVEGTVRSHVAMYKAYQDGVVDVLFTFEDENQQIVCKDDSGKEVGCPMARDALGLPDNDFDLLASAAQYRRVYAGPPGMDAETLQLFRDAFDAVLTDPEFIKEAEAANNPLSYVPGDEIFEAISRELELANRYGDYLKNEIQ